MTSTRKMLKLSVLASSNHVTERFMNAQGSPQAELSMTISPSIISSSYAWRTWQFNIQLDHQNRRFLIDGMSNTQQIDLTICQWQNEIRLLLLQSIKGQSLCTTPFLKEVTLIIQIVQYHENLSTYVIMFQQATSWCVCAFVWHLCCQVMTMKHNKLLLRHIANTKTMTIILFELFLLHACTFLFLFYNVLSVVKRF